MRLLVLGTGYIGLALLNYFKSSNYEIWATTTSKNKRPVLDTLTHKSFVVKSDEKEKLKKLMNQCDGIIITVAPRKGDTYEETYLVTAENISECLYDRTKPFYLLYTGSTSVYGNHNNEWVDEKTTLNPQSVQAKILKQAEDLYLKAANDAITACVLRLGGIYGPDRTLEKRAGMLSGRSIPGSGNQTTNHIHRDDIVSAIDYCIKNRLQGVYNLVNDTHATKEILYSSLAEKLGIPPPKWNPSEVSIHGSKCMVSNEKIKQTGFQFKEISLK